MLKWTYIFRSFQEKCPFQYPKVDCTYLAHIMYYWVSSQYFLDMQLCQFFFRYKICLGQGAVELELELLNFKMEGIGLFDQSILGLRILNAMAINDKLQLN